MKKTNRFCLGLYFTFFLFSSCWFLEDTTPTNNKYLDFSFSKEPVKLNEPVDVTIKWCLGSVNDNILFVIRKLDTIEMEVVEGELHHTDDNAIFVRFIQKVKTEQSDSDISENHPYCKIRMTFKQSGAYELWIKKTLKTKPNSNFESGYYYEKIKGME